MSKYELYKESPNDEPKQLNKVEYGDQITTYMIGMVFMNRQ